MNRLQSEKSPYLLQHAENPVDWYPWGEEAFAAAKSQNKPIFLSIGYSTCHWCHVMEHESFEDSSTAEVMNKNFINIKVDREERPDVDHLYMTTVQLLTGGGGWPMSVWLTPNLKPFYGGTYFPPDEKYGRPGFKSLLNEIAGIWEKDRNRVDASAEQITTAVKEAMQAGSAIQSMELDRTDLLRRAFTHLEQAYDRTRGGFGKAPKFPMPGYMNFLLYYYGETKNQAALEMATQTMRKIIQGGITDQLGGGFARYSTDENWLVPHFEKMLYDNAQLISVMVTLFQATGDPFFASAIRNAADYVLRDLKNKEGGFFSAEDADSEGKEGAFYVWTLAELKKHLSGEMAEAFIYRWGVSAHGNFSDPHTGDVGMNILYQAHSIEETAKQINMSKDETEKLLIEAQKKLFEVRSRRIRPHLDDKIISEWNGLMISALARAGATLGESAYLEAAGRAAQFLRDYLYDESNKILFRRWREGERKIPGFLTDYAFVVQALIDLFEANGHPDWLEWAAELHEKMIENFWEEKGGFSMSRSSDLLFSIKEDSDNVIPSGNSVAAMNSIRLGRLYGRTDWVTQAEQTIKAFSPTLKVHPPALLNLLTALIVLEKDPPQIVIAGPRGRADTNLLLEAAHRVFRPGKTVVIAAPGQIQDRLAKINPAFKSMRPVDENAAAYVCENFSCQKPVTKVEELKECLKFT